MKILLGCVNSSVSLVGYDTETSKAFWYCPGNVLRVCGICIEKDALWISSDNTLTCMNNDGILVRNLPGPMENLAHSVKALSGDILAIVDTGNSRILLLPADIALENQMTIISSPLEEWGDNIPVDAIHCNDIIPWRDGFLVSAFSHQPFRPTQKACPTWKSEGLGLIFYMRRKNGKTLTSVVASGLNCPHSMVEYNGDIYCCSSSTGEFYHLTPAANGTLNFEHSYKVTDKHFLRGALRLEDGWLLGGSSRREKDGSGGMILFHLKDNGDIKEHFVAAAGEIYDIIPWDTQVMKAVAKQCQELPLLDLPGEFPLRCNAALADI